MVLNKKKILLCTDWYEPGFKAGGPIRSCVNFVRHMESDYLIDVLTSDRDLDAKAPYPGIQPDCWIAVHENVRIYYGSRERLHYGDIRRLIREIKPDFIYLNSMFSKSFTIFPLLGYRKDRLTSKIVLAPRGMLRSSALRFKSLKKRIFLRIFRAMGFHKTIQFQASDQVELADIRAHFGSGVKAMLLPNFPGQVVSHTTWIRKNAGEIKILFTGRIHPIKNLDFLLELLAAVPWKVELSIVGNLEDAAYWERCKAIIGRLPSNIAVNYIGEVPNDQLAAIITGHHVFCLPTRGENFGHAILEALSQGRPSIISDQTPWRHLFEHKAGWDLPLDRPDLFQEAIGQAAQFDQDQYDEWSKATHQFVLSYSSASELKKDYQKLFS